MEYESQAAGSVEVIGTGSGPYRLDFSFVGGLGKVSVRSVDGTAVPGKRETFVVTAAANGTTSVAQASDEPVLGGAGGLPATGSSLTPVIAIAAGLMAVGILFVVLARRRHASTRF